MLVCWYYIQLLLLVISLRFLEGCIGCLCLNVRNLNSIIRDILWESCMENLSMFATFYFICLNDRILLYHLLNDSFALIESIIMQNQHNFVYNAPLKRILENAFSTEMHLQNFLGFAQSTNSKTSLGNVILEYILLCMYSYRNDRRI